jgi:hypothetical protein
MINIFLMILKYNY